jgi:hypothetical protein
LFEHRIIFEKNFNHLIVDVQKFDDFWRFEDINFFDNEIQILFKVYFSFGYCAFAEFEEAFWWKRRKI